MLKTFTGFLFLFLFLFPQVQKGLHDYEHRFDQHCNATAEVHLHSLEHVCDFCDFTISIGFQNDFSFNTEVIQTVSDYYFQFPVNFHSCSTVSLIPARAPPVLVA